MKKQILLLGSGLMSETVVDYLLKRPEVQNNKTQLKKKKKNPQNHITIASNIEKDAKAIADKKQRCQSSYIDVTNDVNKINIFIDKNNNRKA